MRSGLTAWNAVGHGRPLVSVGIPLYRSARFFDVITGNIDTLPADGIEILVSDRHCADDTLERLRRRFAGDSRLRYFSGTDALDWVGNINGLMRQARGSYWRLLPHDDVSPPGALERLIDALEKDPGAVLAYGPTRAVNLNGDHLPERDRPKPHGIPQDRPWSLGVALDMFWEGWFDGAFKGLIRQGALASPPLPIRSTRDQIFPERAWLFALSLRGHFRFVPSATYVKRFHADSTHAGWSIGRHHFLSATRAMIGYAGEGIADPGCRRLAREYLIWRALERIGWIKARQPHPGKTATHIPHLIHPSGPLARNGWSRRPLQVHEDALGRMLNRPLPC